MHIKASWGGFELVDIAKALFGAALQDPANQKMVLLSESCLPLYPPTLTYAQLISEPKSRINACSNEVLGLSSDNPPLAHQYMVLRGRCIPLLTHGAMMHVQKCGLSRHIQDWAACMFMSSLPRHPVYLTHAQLIGKPVWQALATSALLLSCVSQAELTAGVTADDVSASKGGQNRAAHTLAVALQGGGAEGEPTTLVLRSRSRQCSSMQRMLPPAVVIAVA